MTAFIPVRYTSLGSVECDTERRSFKSSKIHLLKGLEPKFISVISNGFLLVLGLFVILLKVISLKRNIFQDYILWLTCLILITQTSFNSLFTVQHITSSSKGPRRSNLNEQSTIIQYSHSACPHKTSHYQQSSFPSVPFLSEVNAAWLWWITVDNAP